MNRKIYRTLAKKHCVSVTKVKQDMQVAINAAYKNPNPSSINVNRQNAVPRMGEIPTQDDVIRYAVSVVHQRKENR